jgi:hypothetical protein
MRSYFDVSGFNRIPRGTRGSRNPFERRPGAHGQESLQRPARHDGRVVHRNVRPDVRYGNVIDNVYHSLNQFYMAGLLAASMVVIAIIVMHSMYHDKRRNVIIGRCWCHGARRVFSLYQGSDRDL